MNTMYEAKNGYIYCGISDVTTMSNASYKTGINFASCSAVFAICDPVYLCLVFKLEMVYFVP